MSVFIGTFENRVDKKGRVSVPATFRQALAGEPFQGIVAFRSHRCSAVEGCGMAFMERLVDSVSEIDFFSEDQDDLASTVFAGSHQLAFDGDGRIVLPPTLAEHAGISDRAAFVGKGRIFQIWEPNALQTHLEESRSRARDRKLTIPLASRGGAA